MIAEIAAAKEAEAARPQIQELTNFLGEYTAKMLSIGTYTARIERCVCRIAGAYGYEASLMIFVRHFIISVMDPADNSIRRTYVKTGAAARISFDLISELSALSWEIYDEKIPLERARAAFAEILASQKKSLPKLSFCSASQMQRSASFSAVMAAQWRSFLQLQLLEFAPAICLASLKSI